MATKCVHKYRLKDLARKRGTHPYLVYICIKQQCSHNIRVDLVDGKLAECNRCGQPFIMRLAKLKHGDRIIVRPHCDNCTKTPSNIRERKETVMNSIDDLLSSIVPRG